MSTVLARMALRARGPLSSVGPKAPPLFAPADAGSEMPSPAVAHAIDRPADPRRTPNLPPVMSHRPGPRGANPGADSERPDPAARPEPAAPDAPPLKPAPTPPGPTTTVAREATASRPPARSAPDLATPAPIPARRIARPTDRADAPLPADTDEAPQPRAAARRPRRSRATSLTEPATAATTAPPSAAATPDITISIGHIEVRAAPPPTPAARPAFRPQVSLEDFLSGHNGGRR